MSRPRKNRRGVERNAQRKAERQRRKRSSNPRAKEAFELECSPGVNALLEPMSERERRVFLQPIDRLTREFIQDIQAGKALSMAPFHQWTFEHGEHQLALNASRKPSGSVRIECQTFEETLGAMAPANILKALFELGAEGGDER